MVISSRTPDGWSNRCHFCGNAILIEPSAETLDAPCSHCGCLLWFMESQTSMSAKQPRKPRSLHKADDVVIDVEPRIVSLVPQSVACENLVTPIAESNGCLIVAMATPIRPDIIDTLSFVLDRRIMTVPMPKSWVLRQIEKCYGTR